MQLAQVLTQPGVDWHALAPDVVLAVTACLVLVADLFLPREAKWLAWVPLLILIVAAGLYPRLVLGVTDEAVQALIGVLGS